MLQGLATGQYDATDLPSTTRDLAAGHPSMNGESILIKRYPNRRYYARHLSKYVSLTDIEQLVSTGHDVQIQDSQTNDDLTRSVLTQIIMEQHPDKMALFPIDMLHFILRSNDTMTGLLRDYFRQSLTYLDYLQQHRGGRTSLTQPMHWVQRWLDALAARPAEPPTDPGSEDAADLRRRIAQLEERLRRLESPDA